MKRDWLRGYPRRVRDCGWEAVKNALMSDSEKKSRKKKLRKLPVWSEDGPTSRPIDVVR